MGYTVPEYMPKPGKGDISPLNESKRAPELNEVLSAKESSAGLDATIFDYCAGELRTYDADRYFSCLLAPPLPRRALLALYAFNLEIAKTRETVSEPMLGQIRLQWWREALDGIYAGSHREHAVVLALNDAIQTHSLSRSLFDEMIDGRERDLEETPPLSVDDVLSYVSATSGALNCLAGEVLGAADSTILRDAGKGYAMTGLVRAIPFHAEQGRSWLPVLPGHAVFKGAENLADPVKELVQAAETCRQAALAGIGSLPKLTRLACLPLATCRSDLSRIRDAAFDPFTARYAGSLSRRFKMLGGYWMGRF